MNSQLPTVSKGDPISADAWNALVGRVNKEEASPSAPRSFTQAKGEFWIKNATNATIQAFDVAPVSSFVNSFSNAADAKTALAQDAIVLNASSGSSDFFAVALESIAQDCVGRATLAQGPLVFAALAGSDYATRNQRAKIQTTGTNAGRFVRDNDGDFVIVAIDSSSRFAALCRVPKEGASYTAGEGISISDDNAISSDAGSFTWGYCTGSSYTFSSTIPTRGYYQARLLFSSDFKSESRKDDGSGLVVGLNKKSKTVVTGVNFANQTVTTETINVLN